MSQTTTPTILLVGNPNTGKTSIFNALCGVRAGTANFPGFTTDLKSAKVNFGEDIELIDLPGLYSLESTHGEEQVTAQALSGDLCEFDAVVIVADATNMARTLSLAGEVLEKGTPALLLLNMIDDANRMQLRIDIDELTERLGCPVVPISAKTGEGLCEAKLQIGKLVSQDVSGVCIKRPQCSIACDGCEMSARHRWSQDLVQLTTQPGLKEERSVWSDRIDKLVTRPIVGSLLLFGAMLFAFFLVFYLADWPMGLIETAFERAAELLEHLLPAESVNRLVWTPAVATLTFGAIFAVLRAVNRKVTKTKLTLSIMTAVVVALLPLQDFKSLLLDGIIGGVGGVVVFLPQICILFFLLTLLEDSGYMARAAFVMEKVMRFAGLPGKAFVPMLSAHACAIPAIMAARSIESWRDRLVTILVLPLLTCSARLPVYAMVASLLFGNSPFKAACVFAGGYFLGIIAALVAALVFKFTFLKGDPEPMILELPPYRVPSLSNALYIVVDRARVFLRQAGTVILVISLVLWAAATYPKLPESRLNQIEADAQAAVQLEHSFAGRLGKTLDPVFSPLGFDWKLNVAVVSSFAAREVLVSTLAVFYEVEDSEGGSLVEKLAADTTPDGTPVYSTATCVSLFVFFVLAMQCLPTQAVTMRETGSWKWAAFQLIYMTLLAYSCAFISYRACYWLS